MSVTAAFNVRQFQRKRSRILNTIYSAASRYRNRLAALVRSRTPLKIDSIGLLVRGCRQCH
jgi:hypothetical protein